VKKKIYLACPYSHKDPKVRDERVKTVNMVAGDLMLKGHLVFSPLSHSDCIADHISNAVDPCDHGFWLEQCITFLVDWADELWVFQLDGWKESWGISVEVDTAKTMGIPVKYF
jgi:hypothetical protein